MTELLEPMAQMTLAHRVAAAIRSAILRGELAQGEKLVQTRLADRLGVSQGIVREALLRLEHEGFVVSVPYKGTFVTELDERALQELFTLRIVLETFAVREALAHAQPAESDRLAEWVTHMHAAADRGDLEALAAGDLGFHQTIVALAGHALLLEIWSSIAPRIQLFMASKGRLYRDLHEVAETHRPLLEAMQRRDPRQAAQAIERHIVDAARMAIQNWRQESA